jgi:hypothetical protein
MIPGKSGRSGCSKGRVTINSSEKIKVNFKYTAVNL